MSLACINPREYEDFRSFLADACGIFLGENKHYLVESRLSRLMTSESCCSLGDLLQRLRGDPLGGALRERVIEAMTTNETSWFRDNYPFSILAKIVLPELASGKNRAPRIWSAACSTGQEPYSISMVLQEYLANNPGSLPDARVIATDISPAVLESARSGFYDARAVARGLPENLRLRYFDKDKNHREGRWRVRGAVRERVSFTRTNLLASYKSLGRFDIIFCRNVLIYFSVDLKTDILGRMAEALNPGGYLFLGASELVSQYSSAFERLSCHPGVVFRKK